MKLTCFCCFQVLKLYAWELSFQEKVNAVRLKELDTIKRLAYLNSANTFFWTTEPVLVISLMICFTVYNINTVSAVAALRALSFNYLLYTLCIFIVFLSN